MLFSFFFSSSLACACLRMLAGMQPLDSRLFDWHLIIGTICPGDFTRWLIAPYSSISNGGQEYNGQARSVLKSSASTSPCMGCHFAALSITITSPALLASQRHQRGIYEAARSTIQSSRCKFRASSSVAKISPFASSIDEQHPLRLRCPVAPLL